MAYRVRPLGRLRLEAEGVKNAGTGGPYISGPGVLGFPSATLGLPFVVSPSNSIILWRAARLRWSIGSSLTLECSF